MNTFGSGA
jgi:Ca2+-binding EF-hand superfamily protein